MTNKIWTGSIWISSSGDAAHPSSPVGGGGAGAFTIPGSLGVNPYLPFDLPHPQSAAGQKLSAHDIAAAVTGGVAGGQVATSNSEDLVEFIEFNTKSKGKYVEAIKSNSMGVHPQGNFPFVNAVEVIFKITNAQRAKNLGFVKFRCRQRAAVQEVWEKELKDGKVTAWNRTMSVDNLADDPDEGLQYIKPPILAFHDAPGFMATTNEATLKGPGNKYTSRTAAAVFLRQNFVAWVDGMRSSRANETWQRVSPEIQWHSNQSIVLNIFGKTRWLASPDGSEIGLGHSLGKPND